MKKLLAPLLLALSFLLLAGCSNNMAVITAGLQADLVRVQRAGNGDIQVTWRVRNPNVVGYVLTRHVVKISLDGVPVGTLTSEERIGIPALNEAVRTTVLAVSDAAARPAIDQALARGSAGYTLDATIWLLIVDEDIEKFRLQASGTVPTGAE
jgi:LEA14-like dessication related protein